MDVSYAEENYLKAIYRLSTNGNVVNTNALAEELATKPASVSDMLKKLSAKNLIHYEKYRGVSLTPVGRKVALWIVRKHRLWEVFLVEKLSFSWDEVHEVAEQLEHIQSKRLIDQLDAFLGHPKTDPHGEPIPDREGNVANTSSQLLRDAPNQVPLRVVSVNDSSSELLQYLDKIGISIGSRLKVLSKIAYDESMELEVGAGERRSVSKQITENIYVNQDSPEN